ncbi:hypothetical protein MRB53_016847 [Persea americana]|uniref:Uncharacterized protein n=1 Tax=Persea americana TaxID=3435 RepID=A0ACC2M3W3_PERAE|nr:hypothetical protein MRB53_016847 [Persea americana]
MENQTHFNNLSFHDFTNNNMDQITDILRGENSVANPITASYHGNHFHELKFDGGFVEDGGFCPTPEDMFHLNSASMSDPSSILEALQPCAEDIDVNVGDEYSTATAVRMNCSGDRSRTLISERRRRGRMKEKLYALRSLVPNITKMDKASIVGDAVLYVQQLQKQAKKLRGEIAGLESSLKGGPEQFHGSSDRTLIVGSKKQSIFKKIVQMDVFQVEEGGFYVRTVCRKGEGVVVALYKALESLTCFHVQSSNVAALSEQFVLTFTLNVKVSEDEKDISTLKLWVMGSLLSQGFEFETPMA